MNVFLTASLRGKEKYDKYYSKIYNLIKKGHTVYADHVFDYDVERVHNWDPEYRFDYYQNVIEKIKYCDLLVAELSLSTINVIYEICIALELKKNAIVLYTGNEEPKFIEEIDPSSADSRLQIINYTSSNLEPQLLMALSDAKKMINQRFTILLPTHIINYLDKIFRDKKIPRAVYIRNLIEKDMKEKNL